MGRTARVRGAAGALLLLWAAACASDAPKGSGSTVVERTRVTRITGTAADRDVTEGPAESLDRPGVCKHVWRSLASETHVYQDTSGELPLTALCTPIACDKCGLVRHECVRLRRRR